MGEMLSMLQRWSYYKDGSAGRSDGSYPCQAQSSVVTFAKWFHETCGFSKGFVSPLSWKHVSRLHGSIQRLWSRWYGSVWISAGAKKHAGPECPALSEILFETWMQVDNAFSLMGTWPWMHGKWIHSVSQMNVTLSECSNSSMWEHENLDFSNALLCNDFRYVVRSQQVYMWPWLQHAFEFNHEWYSRQLMFTLMYQFATFSVEFSTCTFSVLTRWIL